MVHRPPALSPDRHDRGAGAPILLALLALELIWFAWFALEPLPNAGAVAKGGTVTRIGILVRALPAIVPGLKYRDSYLGIGLENLGHFENLSQRVPIVLAAGWIVATATAAGLLLIRGLKLRGLLDRWERVALGFGLGTIALGLAALILGRLGLLTPGIARTGLGLPIGLEASLAILGRWRPPDPLSETPTPGLWPSFGFLAVTGPFLLIMFLGAMLPCIDFDALEYHLQAPKEYHRAGRIAFLPHNVYASMPFGVEMLHLIGMEVMDDWWVGALVGQLVVAAFAPASAAMIVLAARRIGSPRAAWVAGVCYLTAPWIYRLAVLPYVEGPLCYFHAALAWIWVRTEDSGLRTQDSGLGGTQPPSLLPLESSVLSPRSLILGVLAGGAMAIKYPGLISAVIPASAWAAWSSWRARSWRPAIAFGIGLAVVVGPWLGKNVADTGNPVYPLGYSVFGGKHWSHERDAQWSAAHGPKPIEAAAFGRSVLDVAGRSDWQSPLFAALTPLAFLVSGSRKWAFRLSGLVAYLFLTWWLLTHRLDRFWLPILPALAVLAGLGSDWSRSRAWTLLLGGILGVGIAMNLVFCSTALAGLNDWTGNLVALRRSVPELLNPAMARLDVDLPPGARVLLVGQAAAFHVDHLVLYNTVFNDDRLEALVKGRSMTEVRENLARLGVTHVYVDWSEIERYRSPGNYGFTPFVTPEVFARLVTVGILRPPTRPGPRQELYEVGPASVKGH